MTFEEWCKANNEPVYTPPQPIHDVQRWQRACARYRRYLEANEAEVWQAVGELKSACLFLDALSRLRNAQDTTDEWLRCFVHLEKQVASVRQLLGDQSDLLPTWNNEGGGE
jgi:NifB/MoaA-like Fe-S oxidoreductase